MLLIRTRVGPSSIHGLGLFSTTPIPRGTPIWRLEPGFDQRLAPEQVDALPGPACDHVHWFAWWDCDRRVWVLSGDHACFMNHADVPNTGVAGGAPDGVTVALRDLAAGEELTCDYWAFDGKAGEKLGTATPRHRS